MKHFKEDVTSITQGNDCGLSFAGFDDVRTGDVIECFVIKQERAKLD
jgi:translation initiation factor IF-2